MIVDNSLGSGISRQHVENTVIYGKQFLKQLRDDASAVSLLRLFHCGIVQGKKEFLYAAEDDEMVLNL